MLRRKLFAVAGGQDFPQHSVQLGLQFANVPETLLRVFMGGAQQKAIQRQILPEQGFLAGGGQPGCEHAVDNREAATHSGQGTAYRVNVRCHRGAFGGYLRGLETFSAVNVAKSADAADRTQIQKLHLVLGDHNIVRFEVVVHHPAGMQVLQGWQDFQDVANGNVHIKHVTWLFLAAVLQGRATHILHDNEATGDTRIVNEIEDLNNPGVGNVCQELPLGVRHHVVTGLHIVHQTLEHHPAAGHVSVIGQVNPAHAAVCDHPGDFILVGHHVAGFQLRRIILFRRVDQGTQGVNRPDKRQRHHAVRDGAALAVRAATLPERGQCLFT